MSATRNTSPTLPRRGRKVAGPAIARPQPPQTSVSRGQLVSILGDELSSHWRRSWPRRVYLSDDNYYIPPLDEALTTIHESRPLFRRWTDELFDCDDFAFVLKAHFCRAATSHRRRRLGYCFGIVWKTKPVAHAMNWIVYRERDPGEKKGERLVFGLVEPQWFRNPAKLKPIRPVAPDDGGFYFVTA